MQKILILINDAPYRTEKANNAFRLAMQIQKDFEDTDLCVFLMDDAVSCALPNQDTPNGYSYNIERMVRVVISKNGKVKLCGPCVNDPGLKELKLVEGAEWSTLKELTQLTMECDKMVTF
ncbi:MAG: DsrE family protein [Bacteroidales bacterium]